MKTKFKIMLNKNYEQLSLSRRRNRTIDEQSLQFIYKDWKMFQQFLISTGRDFKENARQREKGVNS